MKYQLFYTKRAISDLDRLDLKNSQRIIKKLKYFSEQPNPVEYSNPLKGIYQGLFRFRIGEYRIIFSRDSKGLLTLLTILTVKHRKDVYTKSNI